MVMWIITAIFKVALAFFITCFPFWLSFRFYDQVEAWIIGKVKKVRI